MNYFCVAGALVGGIEAVPVRVECTQSRRLPYLQVLGLPHSRATELRERVIAALGTLEEGRFRLPARRFTVQVVPAAQGWATEHLDLAVALALLGSARKIPAERLSGLLACGRLGLDGSLAGEIPASVLRRLLPNGGSAILPWAASEALEAAHLERGGGFANLAEVVEFLRAPSGCVRGKRATRAGEAQVPPPNPIWSRLPAGGVAARVIEIAAAGSHHVLFPGPAHVRADLYAHALSALLPPLGARESDEVRSVYALAGLDHVLPSRPYHVWGSKPGLPALLSDRRFRAAEEILLAHHGVLYVDGARNPTVTPLPAIAAPMRLGAIPARACDRRNDIPADVVVVASAPLCACGASDGCVCRPTEARRFEARWRGLFSSSFDLRLALPPERARVPSDSPAEWPERAARVQAARDRSRARGGPWNGRLDAGAVFGRVAWSVKARRLWDALEGRTGPAGAYLAAARVAVTICDLRESSEVQEADLLEALHYFPEAGGKSRSSPALERNSSAIP
jgi:magnesium chelatase family protein